MGRTTSQSEEPELPQESTRKPHRDQRQPFLTAKKKNRVELARYGGSARFALLVMMCETSERNSPRCLPNAGSHRPMANDEEAARDVGCCANRAVSSSNAQGEEGKLGLVCIHFVAVKATAGRNPTGNVEACTRTEQTASPRRPVGRWARGASVSGHYSGWPSRARIGHVSGGCRPGPVGSRVSIHLRWPLGSGACVLSRAPFGWHVQCLAVTSTCRPPWPGTAHT